MKDPAIKLGLDLAYRFGLLHGDRQLNGLAKLYRQGMLQNGDAELLRLKLRPAFRYAAQHQDELVFNLPKNTAGEIVMGRAGKELVRIPLEALSHHLTLVGATGSGKTYYILSIILQLLRLENPPSVWCHDYIKVDFSRLIALNVRSRFRILNSKTLFINILQPPDGVAKHVHGERMLEVLGDTLDLKEPTRLAVRRVLHKLYDEGQPNLADLADAFNEADVNEVIKANFLSKVEGVAAAVPSLYHTRRGFRIEQLEKLNLVWDLHDLGAEIQNLIVAWSRAAAFCRRIENQVHADKPSLVIIDDEAWRHFGKQHEGSYLCQLASVARSTGIALVLANQTSALSRNVLSNSGTKVLGVVGHGLDLETMSTAMAMTHEQKRWSMTHLKTARFVAKTSHCSNTAFPFYALRVRPLPNPTQADIRAAAESLVQDLLPEPVDTAPPPKPSVKEQSEVQLSDDALTLLRSIHEIPFQFLTTYYQLNGLGSRRGTAAKKELSESNVVREHAIEAGRSGRCPRALQILQVGFQALGLDERELLPEEFLRAFGKHHITASLTKQGFTIEHSENSDVLARRNAEVLAVVVCTNPDGLEARLDSITTTPDCRKEVHCLSTPCLRLVQERLRNSAGWTAHYVPLVLIENQRVPLEPLDSPSTETPAP